MKQKVQIDVLDISLYDRGNHDEEDDFAGGSPSNPPEKKPLRKLWWKSKKVWLAFGLPLVIASLGLTYFFLNPQESKQKGHAVNKVSVTVQGTRPRSATFQDFIVHFRDRSGRDRFLVCALALETSSPEKLLYNEDLTGIRKVLYKMLQKKSIDDPSQIRDENRLKNEIFLEMNQRLGSKVVSKIYFTKFVVL
jgi:flagellar basal body-associated protein FliL